VKPQLNILRNKNVPRAEGVLEFSAETHVSPEQVAFAR
jgi:hypothetical protein